MTVRFWENGNLAGLDRDQWEAICDGCGKCCLVKLEDEESGEVFYTDLRCRHLDEGNCRCTVYETRRQTVPACIELAPDRLEELWLMPPSCAYRRIAEGRALPAWHHLVCGDRNRVLDEGRSVRGRSISEDCVAEDGFEDRLADWPVLETD